MNELQTQKIPLKQTQEKHLKAYYFITRPVNITIQNEGVIRTLAFDLDNGFQKAAELNKKGFFLKYVGNEEIQRLLDLIYQGEAKIITSPSEPPPQPAEKPKTTKEQFVHNLMLIADDYLKGRDSEQLKDLIKKI